MIDLQKDVKYIKGVGPKKVLLLNKLGILTLKDLITYYPRTYEDRSKPKFLYECEEGEEALVEVIACSRVSNVRLRGKTMQRLIVRDETASATITWFNQPYLKDKFNIGEKYKIFGNTKLSKKAKENLGEYIGIVVNDKFMVCDKINIEDCLNTKGNHSGLTKKETTIPLIVI